MNRLRSDLVLTLDELRNSEFSAFPIIDLRSDADYRRWRLRNSIMVCWHEAVAGKLYALLPPRGSNVLVAASDVATIEECLRTLDESGYHCPFAILLPNEPPMHDRIDTGPWQSEDPQPVLWQPSPVLISFSPLIADAYSDSPDLSLSMLDVGAGSGRDAVWPMTAQSPLARKLGCVAALDKHCGMLGRAETLAKMNNIYTHWLDQVKLSHSETAVLSVCELPHLLLCLVDARSDEYMAKVAEVSGNAEGFHIVHVARYLDRRSFECYRNLVRPGGFILFHHFLVGSFRPVGEANLLKSGELADQFGPAFGFEVIRDVVVNISDGRPTSHFCARKT